LPPLAAEGGGAELTRAARSFVCGVPRARGWPALAPGALGALPPPAAERVGAELTGAARSFVCGKLRARGWPALAEPSGREVAQLHDAIGKGFDAVEGERGAPGKIVQQAESGTQ